MFGHRQRLAGERGFVHMQIPHLEEPQVGGHAVTGLEQHDIARHQILGGNPQLASVAPHGRLRGHHPAERLDGFLRLGLLEKSDHRVDQHHAENHRRIHPLAEQRGDSHGKQEDVNERLVELLEKLHPSRCAAMRRDAVRAEFTLSAGDLPCG